MKVLIADQKQVTKLLPMGECIDLMADTLRMLAGGDARLPLRMMMALPGGPNLMGLMPAYLGGIESVGVKVITSFPANYGTEYDTHQGVVILFDTTHGRLRAIVDGTAVTAIRTAAVSGVATRLLARADAGDLALIGAGTQARTHLEAMMQVRKLRRVRVYSLPIESAHEFARRESARHGIEIEVVESARAAAAGADLICTVTTAREPVVMGEWVAPGAHINAVGAFSPTTRELDSAAVVNARLYVDRRESTRSEAGEFIIPKNAGLIGDDHIAGEIGELLLGRVPGRQSPEEITLFKSLGLAVEDLASAYHVLDKAQRQGIGTWVEIGGEHFGSA
ncbi:MAG: ornithine cyclodeaminase family protein [Anaerolineae bacterium]|nr:ornithine cyclodeaminase family protein [Anaerolineae bacterium]